MAATKEARDAYVTKKKEQLDRLNARIDEAEKKALNTGKATVEAYHEKIRAAKARYAESVAKLQEVKDATADTWEKYKADTENVFGAFRDSLRTFRSHF